MTITKFGDDRDRVKPGILGERCRDDLERVCVRLEAVCLHASQRLCVLRQHARYVDLWCAASTDQRAVREGERVSEATCVLSSINAPFLN